MKTGFIGHGPHGLGNWRTNLLKSRTRLVTVFNRSPGKTGPLLELGCVGECWPIFQNACHGDGRSHYVCSQTTHRGFRCCVWKGVASLQSLANGRDPYFDESTISVDSSSNNLADAHTDAGLRLSSRLLPVFGRSGFLSSDGCLSLFIRPPLWRPTAAIENVQPLL